jgi:hypothetical protein
MLRNPLKQLDYECWTGIMQMLELPQPSKGDAAC